MNKIKTVFITFFSLITSYLGILAIPVFTLLICNFIDYKTAQDAAPYRAEPGDKRPIKSKISLEGISKKVNMYLLIIVMYLVDMMIRYTLIAVFPQINYPDIFAIVTACWLVFNEIISILENMDDAGTPIPPFLMPLMKKIKETITIDVEDSKERDQHEDIPSGN